MPLPDQPRVAGVKQSTRAVREGRAERVLLSRDADPAVLAALVALCREKGVPTDDGFTMSSLGEACGVRVGASAAALLKSGLC